jgi:hypothetical protein
VAAHGTALAIAGAWDVGNKSDAAAEGPKKC